MPTQDQIIKAINEGELAWVNLMLNTLETKDPSPPEVCDYDLSGYNFQGWIFGGITFRNVNFSKASFRDTRLLNCFISNCNFSNANFENADLSYYDPETKIKYRDPVYSNMLVECDFSNAQLPNADLRGCILNGSTFRGANLSHANVAETLLAWATGIAIDLDNADLRGAILPSFKNDEGGIGRFTDLVLANGIEKAIFENAEVLKDYLSKVSSLISEENFNKYSPNQTYTDTLLRRIKALNLLYQNTHLSEVLVRDLATLRQDILIDIQNNANNLKFLKGRLLEELIAELLSSYGWDVDLTKKTCDGGYDIFAISKDISGLRSSWIIECKGWKDEVGIDVVRALYGVKNDIKVSNVLLATTSEFSGDVLRYKASRYDLELKDYHGLLEWINVYKPEEDGRLYYKSS